MKREELIADIQSQIDSLDRQINNAASFNVRIQLGCHRAGLREAIGAIEQHLPANSITLTLPVYADGDPRAGEAVGRHDVIFDDERECDMDSFIGVLARPDGSIAYLMESVEGFDGPLYTQKAPMRFFSTPEARDAAMEAAKDEV